MALPHFDPFIFHYFGKVRLISLKSFSYYAFVNPDSIAVQIKSHYKIYDLDYNWIQAAYSIPSLFTCVPAGILIDIYGIR